VTKKKEAIQLVEKVSRKGLRKKKSDYTILTILLDNFTSAFFMHGPRHLDLVAHARKQQE
jgi:hypothetical protein